MMSSMTMNWEGTGTPCECPSVMRWARLGREAWSSGARDHSAIFSICRWWPGTGRLRQNRQLPSLRLQGDTRSGMRRRRAGIRSGAPLEAGCTGARDRCDARRAHPGIWCTRPIAVLPSRGSGRTARTPARWPVLKASLRCPAARSGLRGFGQAPMPPVAPLRWQRTRPPRAD